MPVTNTNLLASAGLVIDSVAAATYVAVKASSAVLYEIEIDNSAVAAASYLKIWNNAAPTVGTTAPDLIIMIPASTSRTIVIPSGITFATALSYAVVTTAGTAGTTATTGSCAVKMIYV